MDSKAKHTFSGFHDTLTPRNSMFPCQDIDELTNPIPTKGGELFSDKLEESSTQTVLTDDKLGEGGFGSVFVGKQTMPDREIAVKILRSEDPTARRLLLQEANIIGRLEHPNIIPVHEVHIDAENRVQILMKKIQGETLEEYVDNLPDHNTRIQKGIDILIQVCHALEFAHANFILHRDIKCDNIMIGPFNEVYLMDWGIALDMTSSHMLAKHIVGTPTHLAPEMLSARLNKLDERTDVYLLGATLHYILLLEDRHDADTIEEIFELAACSDPKEYPDFVPPDIAMAVNKACSRNPKYRFQSVKEFRKRLEYLNKRWDAIKIVQQAEKKLPFVESIKINRDLSHTGLFLIQNSFVQILSLYEAALEIYPGLPEALQGCTNIRVMMIEFYLAQKKPHEALTVYNELLIKNEVLEELIYEEITELHQEDHAKEQIAIARDPKASEEGRKRLVLVCSIGMVSLTIFDTIYRHVLKLEADHQHLTYIGCFMVVILLAGLAFGRKTLFANEIGKELVKVFVMGTLFILMNRLIGMFYDIDPAFIQSIDILILGTTFANAPTIKHSYYILFLCVFMSAASILSKDNSYIALNLFLLSSIVAWLTILFDWFKKEKQENLI